MPFSTSYANSFLNYTFAKTSALTAPNAVYIGLCANDPEADGGTFTELSGNGYARVLISLKGETYPNVIGSASDRAITNVYQINWTKATANWPTANGFGLFSAISGGTPFFYGKLANPVTVPDGAVALFDPNTLYISFSDTDDQIATASATAEVSGTWTFNNTVDIGTEISQSGISVGIASYSYTAIHLVIQDDTVYIFAIMNDDAATQETLYAMDSSNEGGWTEDAMRVWDFGSVPQAVSMEFYNWLTANATRTTG